MNKKLRGNAYSTIVGKLSAVRWYHRRLGYVPAVNAATVALHMQLRLLQRATCLGGLLACLYGLRLVRSVGYRSMLDVYSFGSAETRRALRNLSNGGVSNTLVFGALL